MREGTPVFLFVLQMFQNSIVKEQEFCTMKFFFSDFFSVAIS